MRGLIAVLGTLAVLAAAISPALADTKTPEHAFRKILVVDFHDAIDAVLAAYVKRQVEHAKSAGVDCLVLRIDSPGGRVDLTLELGDLLLGLPDAMHTVAYAPQRAYSGAAITALACDEIVLGKDAHIGDAQPILIGGDEGYKPAGEKMESPLRAKVRDYAQKNGFPPLLAEAMVTADIEVIRVRSPNGQVHFLDGAAYRDAGEGAELVEGWTKKELTQVGQPLDAKGRLLTLTAEQARDAGVLRRTFGDGRAFPASEQELLDSLSAPGATVETVRMTWMEKASRVLVDFSGILAAIVVFSLMIFFFQGPGTITIIGGVALVLTVLIHLTADQLNGFPIFLLLVGALLLAAEAFVIPGFGIAGVLGIAAMGTGFLLLAAGATIGDSGGLDAGTVKQFAAEFVITTIAGFGLLFLVSRWFPSAPFGRRLLLAAPNVRGPVAPVEDAPAVGAEGVALSPLRPSGSAEILGRLTDVVSEGQMVEQGARIRVVAVEGPTVFVRPMDASGEARS